MRPNAIQVTASGLTLFHTVQIAATEELAITDLAKALQPVVIEAHIEQEQHQDGYLVTLNLCVSEAQIEPCLNTIKMYLDAQDPA